jgi:hypothetical protein
MIKLTFLCISLSTVFAFISPQSAAQATHEETAVRSNYAKPLVDLRCPPARARKNYQRLFYRYREIAEKIGLHEWSAF